MSRSVVPGVPRGRRNPCRRPGLSERPERLALLETRHRRAQRSKCQAVVVTQRHALRYWNSPRYAFDDPVRRLLCLHKSSPSLPIYRTPRRRLDAAGRLGIAVLPLCSLPDECIGLLLSADQSACTPSPHSALIVDEAVCVSRGSELDATPRAGKRRKPRKQGSNIAGKWNRTRPVSRLPLGQSPRKECEGIGHGNRGPGRGYRQSYQGLRIPAR
jgi:hypothetical protein